MTVEEVVIAERTRFAREEGLREGRKEAMKLVDKRNKTATIKMLKKGYDVEEIADILDLTVEEVHAIRAKYNSF